MSQVYFKQVVPRTNAKPAIPVSAERRARLQPVGTKPLSRRQRALQAVLLLLIMVPASVLLGSTTTSLAHHAAIAALGKHLQTAQAATDEAHLPQLNRVAVVQGLRQFRGESFTRLILDLNANPAFHATSSDNSLNITVERAQLAASFSTGEPAANGLVQQITATEAKGNVQLGLRFRPGASFAAFTLEAPARLVIDVRDSESPTSEYEAELSRMLTPLGTGASQLRRIVLDPGHGGRDLGAVGPNGYTEKEVTLAVARRLKQELETQLGIEVVLTREDDRFIPLVKRSEIANSSNADLFISIHVNAAEPGLTETTRRGSGDASDEIHGIETYFLNRATSTAEQRLAERENAAGGDGISAPLPTSNATLVESHLLAAYLQRGLVHGLRRINAGAARDRGVKQAPFLVLSNTQIPSSLVEISFISSQADEQRLRTAAFQQKITESLVDGIRAYSANLTQRKTTGTQVARR